MQLQSQTIFFRFRILLDQIEFLHGAEKAVYRGLVQVKGRGQLRHSHLRMVLPDVQENTQSLLQRLARTATLGIRLSVRSSNSSSWQRLVLHKAREFWRVNPILEDTDVKDGFIM